MSSPRSSLTRAEAADRAALLVVRSVEVDLDLDRGAEVFASRTRLRFTCHEPGASVLLDLVPAEGTPVTAILNGVPVTTQVDGGRLRLEGLAAENEVVVEATMAYSRDGQGLHRAVDPADDEAYVYGHLFLDAAPRVFACFDQPDLKAPYTVTVRAPESWTVLGNGAATQVGPGRWQLATTQPLATYFVTVCAGPWASVRTEHDGIPLGLHARASLGDALEAHAEQVLEVTRAAFDHYHRLFGIRYPFGEYHQVFAPEFNAGAMENPGCVVLRDTMVFRGAATREEVLARSNTVAHEMAHMWFGDLVTMRWWDDLWLNESFAEYMAHRTLVDATEFDDAWVDSTMARKMWGYAAERSPSTHPVAGTSAEDADTALQNFDGISYAKGSAVLRQLIAHLGDDVFVAGVGDYLRRHAGGNGTLADFLGAMEQASGASLAGWSRAWLETAGLDVLRVDRGAGQLLREIPRDRPADRPHTLDVAGWTDGREDFRAGVTVTSDATDLPALTAHAGSALVVPNAADLTWATTDLDPASLGAVAAQLPQLPDRQARAVVWIALLDGVYLGRVDPRVLLACVRSAWADETEEPVLSRTAGALLARVVPTFLPPQEQAGAEATIAAAAVQLLDGADPGSSRALLAARTVARASADADLLGRWLAGEGLPPGLLGDNDFRWIVANRLARLGHLDDAGIAEVHAADGTLAGGLAALQARAAVPTAEAKAWAWAELTTARDRSNYELGALATGFWRATPDLVRPYVTRYFAEVPPMGEWLGQDALARVARAAYPAVVVEEDTALASADAIAGGGLGPGIHRVVTDEDSELREALASRATFG